jgi:hypothetical protein
VGEKREPTEHVLSGHKVQETHSGEVWRKAKIELTGEKDTREDMDYPPKELTMGISVEMEHTDDQEIAKQIAKDHLDEDKAYYSKLKKMESTFKKSSLGGKLGGERGLYTGYTLEQKRKFKDARESARKVEAVRQKTEGYSEEPGTREVYVDKAGITKAKVYIAHPSEAPRGRSVRRGAKGGYYYITSEQHKGSNSGTGGKQRQSKKKSSKGKGWETNTGEKRGEGNAEIPQPPDIDGAAETIHISGNGVGLALGIIEGRLVAKKLPNAETNLFIKKMEKLAGERASPEKIIDAALSVAEEEGLEVS